MFYFSRIPFEHDQIQVGANEYSILKFSTPLFEEDLVDRESLSGLAAVNGCEVPRAGGGLRLGAL